MVFNWRATAYTTLEANRFPFRMYDTGLISPSLSLTWQLVFYTLCLNRCFGKKGQPVSNLFHIPTGFTHKAGHAVGLRGFSTDRETVYRNCLPGRKTWRHGDPHAQNYAVCGDDLARINMIYHFYSPGYVEYSSIDKMAKYDWNTFRNCIAFLAGGVAPGTRGPHHNSELTSCYHDAFLTWGHYHNNIVLFYQDSPITRSHFMDPTDRAIKGFYCISRFYELQLWCWVKTKWRVGQRSPENACLQVDYLCTCGFNLENLRRGLPVLKCKVKFW